MGCGKTTIGRRVADRLGWRFVDLDDAVEAAAGRTIPDIFAAEGETGFRRRERVALEESFGLKNAVVATGGGCPCFFDNMDAINTRGSSFYLRNEVAYFVTKLGKSGSKRPLVAGKSEAELRDYVETALAGREPFYLRSHYALHTRNFPKRTTARLIASMIEAIKDRA